jgi:hypothetical protein
MKAEEAKRQGIRIGEWCEYPDCANMDHDSNRLTANVEPVRDLETQLVHWFCRDHRYGQVNTQEEKP